MSLPSAPLEPRLRQAREHTIRALSQHFTDDHLTVDELDARLSKAYQCQSVQELDALVADLPASLEIADAPPAASPARRRWWRPGGDSIIAIMGGAVRRGQWVVPQRLDVIAIMGGVDLDLREAQLSGPVTEVHVVAVMGGVQIRVPPSVRVEAHGIAIMGAFEDHGSKGSTGDATGPVVRVTGVVFMAGVDAKVTTKKLPASKAVPSPAEE